MLHLPLVRFSGATGSTTFLSHFDHKGAIFMMWFNTSLRPDSDEKIISTVCDNDVISGSYVQAFSNKDNVVTPTRVNYSFDVLFPDIFWCERSMCLNMERSC